MTADENQIHKNIKINSKQDQNSDIPISNIKTTKYVRITFYDDIIKAENFRSFPSLPHHDIVINYCLS